MKATQYEGATTDWVGVAWESDKNVENRKIDDCILLVIPACIYGHKICALVDNGATRSFVVRG